MAEGDTLSVYDYRRGEKECGTFVFSMNFEGYEREERILVKTRYTRS